MTSETQKVCFTLYKIGQKSVKKLTLLTLNYFLTGTIRCSLTLPLFLSKSGTIPNSITLSQLYHMTTCEWWNHRPIILFSSPYNLPHKQIILFIKKKKKKPKEEKKLYNTKCRLCLIYVELTNKKFLFISFSFSSILFFLTM